MAPKADIEREDDAALGADGPLTPGDIISRGVTEGGRKVLRLAVDFASGEMTVVFATAAPRPPSDARAKLSQPARDILEVLEDRNGEWVHGADVAMDLPGQPEHKSSAFTVPVAELRKAGLIETSQKHGYRLKRLEN